MTISKGRIDGVSAGAVTQGSSVTITTPSNFFGINVHFADTHAPFNQISAATQASYCSAAGIQTVRTNCSGTTSANTSLPYIQTFAAAGISTLVVIDAGVGYGGANTYTTNYNNAFNNCKAIANILKNYVTYYEVTNEQDWTIRIDHLSPVVTPNPIDGFNPDGSVRSDFQAAGLECLRGYVAGGLDGIKSVQPAAQVGWCSGVAYGYVVGEMLLKGMDPTGTISATPIDMDFHGMHYYNTEGNPENAGPSNHRQGRTGGTGTYCPDAPAAPGLINTLSFIQSRMNNIPILITEWGQGPDTQVNQATYATNQGGTYFTKRATYNIQGMWFYALFPNPGETDPQNYGVFLTDGITPKLAYGALQTFNTANTTTTTIVTPGTGRSGVSYFSGVVYSATASGNGDLLTLETGGNLLLETGGNLLLIN